MPSPYGRELRARSSRSSYRRSYSSYRYSPSYRYTRTYLRYGTYGRTYLYVSGVGYSSGGGGTIGAIVGSVIFLIILGVLYWYITRGTEEVIDAVFDDS